MHVRDLSGAPTIRVTPRTAALVNLVRLASSALSASGDNLILVLELNNLGQGGLVRLLHICFFLPSRLLAIEVANNHYILQSLLQWLQPFAGSTQTAAQQRLSPFIQTVNPRYHTSSDITALRTHARVFISRTRTPTNFASHSVKCTAGAHISRKNGCSVFESSRNIRRRCRGIITASSFQPEPQIQFNI